MKSLKLKAYAKINIGLQVLNKRADGYHDINTIFSKINLFDEITLCENKDIIVECEPSLNIPMEANLAYKAAEKFNSAFSKNAGGVHIHIKKNIPTGAGLGGGSSDAAAILSGLCELREIPPDYNKLIDIAASLGSDAPFFLDPRTALAKGRGEKLFYFDYEIPYWTLLVYPNINISTKWAYESLESDEHPKNADDFKTALLSSITMPEILKTKIYNDFEKSVFNNNPEIKQIKQDLYKNGSLFALLSGSGSTVYGFFTSEDEASKAAANFQYYQSFLCAPQVAVTQNNKI